MAAPSPTKQPAPITLPAPILARAPITASGPTDTLAASAADRSTTAVRWMPAFTGAGGLSRADTRAK
ncbi:hypothetical protein D3C83_322820 [compost metagenome]